MTREQAEQIARRHQLKRLTEAHAERVKPSEWVIAAIMEAVAVEREAMCAAIKAEDDFTVENGDYMLDSDDCIAVIKGEWKRPDCGAQGGMK